MSGHPPPPEKHPLISVHPASLSSPLIFMASRDLHTFCSDDSFWLKRKDEITSEETRPRLGR